MITSWTSSKGLVSVMIVLTAFLPVQLAASEPGMQDGMNRVLWSAANSFGTMTIMLIQGAEEASVASVMELVFVDSSGGAIVVRMDPGEEKVSLFSNGGTIRVSNAGDGTVRFESSTPSGPVGELMVDSNQINEDTVEAVQALTLQVLTPSEETLDAWTSFTLHEGLVTIDDEGNIEPLPPAVEAMLPDWAQCGLSALGFIASAVGLVGCVTVVGCIAGVAGMTASGIAVGDTCAAAASGGGSDDD